MIYEIKLNIKNYATLNIYTTSENIKNKLVDVKSPIKRTIPVTNASWRMVDKKIFIFMMQLSLMKAATKA